MKLREMLNILQGLSGKNGISQAFLCGGSARDLAIKNLFHTAGEFDLQDIDLTTGDKTIHNLASEFATQLRKDYKFETKQMDDGHTSIYLGNLKIDFSSNFETPEIEKILAKQGIKNPTALQKEMFSRDFTCNALLMDLDLKKITDPTQLGIPDIKRKIIRTCLDPHITMSNNTNRIVRVIYLAAKLNFDVDPELVKWMQEHKDLIRLSDDSYLTKNLNKAFTKNPEKAQELMNKLGLWESVPITESLFPFYEKRIEAKKITNRLNKLGFDNGRTTDDNEFWFADDEENLEDENFVDSDFKDLFEDDMNMDRRENKNPDGSELEVPEDENQDDPLQPTPFYPNMYGWVGFEGTYTSPLEYYSGSISEEPGAITNNPYNTIYQMAWNKIINRQEKRNNVLHLDGLTKLAGVFDNLVKKYPEYEVKIKFLADQDPTPQKKYLQYMVKQLVNKQAMENEIADVIKLFHTYQNKLQQKDINQWNFTQLRDTLFALRNSGEKSKRQERNEIKTSGGVKLYEDDQCVVLRVETKAAACFYGAGTKWCITMDDRTYYEDYVSSNVVFYFILRKDLDKEDNFYKVAVAVQRDGNNNILETDCFDAEDEQIHLDNAMKELTNGGQVKLIIANDAVKVKKGFLARVKNKDETLTEQDYDENLGLGKNEEALIRNDNTPTNILTKIYERHKDEMSGRIFGELLENSNVSGEVIDQMLDKFQISSISAAIGKNLLPLTINKIIDKYNTKYKSNSIEIFRNLLNKKNITPELITKIYNLLEDDDDPRLKHSLLINSKTNNDIIDKIYNKIDTTDKRSSSGQSKNEYYLNKLFDEYKDTNKSILSSLSMNPATPKDLAEKIVKQVVSTDAGDPYWIARESMNKNILHFLSKLNDDAIRRAVAINIHTDPSDLVELAKDSYYNVARYAVINPNFPKDINPIELRQKARENQ